MQVDRHPFRIAFSEKSNYPARPPFPPPPPPWHPSNDPSRYPRTTSEHNNYPSSRPIPPPPPPPPPSFMKNEFYSSTPPPSPPPSSFERNTNFSSPRPPPPPPPPSFFKKHNYDSSPPAPPSQPFFDKKDDPPSPSPPSSNDSSSGTNDSGNEIAVASLGIGILGTLANLASLRFAARQDGTTTASLQLATALAIRDLIATHGVEGTRAILTSGIQTTVQDAQLVAELLMTGTRATRTGASSLVNGVTSSVTSLRSRLLSLSFFGGGTPSPTPNPLPSAPTASGQTNEEEQGMHAQLGEEPNVPWTSDGSLPNFEPGEVPESLFSIGTDPGASEVNNDALGESTTFLGNDTEINNHEIEESTTVQMDDTDIYTPELEESTLIWCNERAKVLEERGLATISCPLLF